MLFLLALDIMMIDFIFCFKVFDEPKPLVLFLDYETEHYMIYVMYNTGEPVIWCDHGFTLSLLCLSKIILPPLIVLNFY